MNLLPQSSSPILRQLHCHLLATNSSVNQDASENMYTDEEDEDDQITGLEVNESSPPQEDYKYEVLNTNQIVENMVSSIREVNSVVQLNTTITRILLNHFQWDKERLYERLYDDSRDALFKEARIVDIPQNPNNNHPPDSSRTNNLSRQHQQPTAKTKASCPICCTETSQLTALACGHAFCRECWVMYLSTKIMEEGQSGRITCPAHDCSIIVDDQTVLPLIIDPRVKLRYQQLITNSYVECNKKMRWCPTPECGHAVKVVYLECQPVKCVCGTKFCFLCGDSWHEPVKCDLIKRWKKKCDDDSETSHWIAANTKECPKCHVTIEKNGGCNHMICKNLDCKTEFCWVCLGLWHHHGATWYNCNRYDESDAKAARDAQERSRALLQRYLFYCKRYMNHMASLKFENKLYAGVKEKMREMQQHNMSWIETKTNQSMIFEENQRDLENATETLSEYLERDITSDNIKDIKQKVQDKYRYCASRRRILLEHVKEGYEQDWWVVADY